MNGNVVYINVKGLYMERNVFSSGTVLINNNMFIHTPIILLCDINDCQDSVNFTNNTFHFSILIGIGNEVTIKDAMFSGLGISSYAQEILIINCTFKNSTTTAITASKSNLLFEGSIVFRNNTSHVGGAIALHKSSTISLEPYTHILFENNYADHVGGAIYTNHASENTVSSMLLPALLIDELISLETLPPLVALHFMEVYRDVAKKISMLFSILQTLKLILQPSLLILTKYAYVRMIDISQIVPENTMSASFLVKFSPFVLRLLVLVLFKG